MSSYAIETVDLTRVFRSKDRVTIALDKVNFRVRYGVIHGLLGPNGAGKTTLIRILSTLLLPTSGEAYVYGYDVVREASKVREVINLVSGEDRPGYGLLTTYDNLKYYGMLYGMKGGELEERIRELDELIGLREFMDKELSVLSTGMAKKYSLARGLINKPKILFLDEPTIGLDVENARAIRHLIKNLIEDGVIETILLTSHYMKEVEDLCDKVSIIDRGRIIAEGTVEELKNKVSDEVVYVIHVYSNGKGVDEVLNRLREIEAVSGVKKSATQATGEYVLRIVMEEEDITGILKILERSDLRIKRVDRDEASLEDVFLKLVGRGLDE